MTRAADDVGGGDEARAADNGDAVVAGPDDAVADPDVGAARNVDPIGVGALVGRGDGQGGDANAGAPGEGDVHLLAVSELEVTHAQAVAAPERQSLREGIFVFFVSPPRMYFMGEKTKE